MWPSCSGCWPTWGSAATSATGGSGRPPRDRGRPGGGACGGGGGGAVGGGGGGGGVERAVETPELGRLDLLVTGPDGGSLCGEDCADWVAFDHATDFSAGVGV